MDSETYLYSSTDNLEASQLFILPESYFVELLSNATESLYYARYNDVYGYIKKALVKPVKSEPQMPFLNNVSFRVFVPSGANLRSTPQNLGATNLIYSIPFLETNILYYGKISGEEAISKKGTTWFFCKYYVNNLSYSGYVYSPLCDCLSPISKNEEVVEFISTPLVFEEDITQTSTNKMEGLSQTAQTIIIVAISLPCLLFIYLLFKPTRIIENSSTSSKARGKRQQNKNKISKLRHSDYFEFDDDF